MGETSFNLRTKKNLFFLFYGSQGALCCSTLGYPVVAPYSLKDSPSVDFDSNPDSAAVQEFLWLQEFGSFWLKLE